MRLEICLLVALPLFASGRTLYVDAAKGSDANSGLVESAAKASIQAAADIATDDDVVMVYPGTYAPITVENHRFIIASTEGAWKTIIDGRDETRCATLACDSNYLARVTLRGFTLMRGRETSSDRASGVYRGILENCIVTRCNGAVIVRASRMFNSLVVNNKVGAYGLLMHGDAYNCTLANNNNSRRVSWDQGLYNVLVWSSGNGYYTSSGFAEDHYNCYKGSDDPHFVDAANGDYRLAEGSPCIDAGNNAYVSGDKDLAGNVRIENGTVDIGCYEYSEKDFGVVTNVTARQIRPWRGLVEINYELTEDVKPSTTSNVVALLVTVRDREHGCKYQAKTFTRTPTFEKGKHRLVWNAKADGYSFASTSVVFSVAVKDAPAPYCVIDLSGGTTATSYPISYIGAVPVGGWSDEYKTTKLLLRCIEAGSFIMGDDQTDESHRVTLTKPFYMGVFEVTQRQWELVMGTRPSYFNNDDYYASRPVEQVSYNMVRGSSSGAGWPADNAVDEASFLGMLRAKTNLDFDLPTEAQWEYACRAGTTTDFNSGENLLDLELDAAMDVVGRYKYNGGDSSGQSCAVDKGTAYVGSYRPNSWGLFDMHGNVREWVKDWYGTMSYGIDPSGAFSGSYRCFRGGLWDYRAHGCTSEYRDYQGPSCGRSGDGFRLSMTLSK